MDIRTCYLVASSDDADEIMANPRQPERWPGFACLNLDLEKLVDLLALCEKLSLDEALISSFEVVNNAGEYGPWLIRLPTRLCTILRHLEEADQQSTAEQWAQTEAFAHSTWGAGDLQKALQHLGALARLASEAELELLLHQGVEGEAVAIQ
ncbi:hypothetical protein MIB92_16770 [Aestuariirhabdus sp. Z084]|uniref:hypothetical protein n=1 Tax=Aestuariirhabdus haliotis TaxID=2918751 RepID=UPI00201B450F|nr:hypothetical protein [Aestuariirhabdus haliotis]MCL6417314.1 hypothetical protein [Aestuariirhabdus haliotis]MCL6421259.1 hypothetical protein [Aestuariirhabdus haliotis]